MSDDFIPGTDTGKLVFANNFAQEIPNYASQVGVTNQQVTQVQTENNTAQQSFNDHQAQKAALAAAKQAKDIAIATVIATIRALARIIHASPDVTDEILAALGLTVPDTTATTHGLSFADRPYITKLEQAPLEHKFYYANVATPDSKAKPAAAVGVNVYLSFGDTKPVGKQGMSMAAFHRSSPFTHGFDAADVGKTAWWVLAWTDGDEEGTLSEPYAATVTG